MEKGQIVNIRIEDISNEGSGIGKFEGMAIFVPGVTLGDVCDVEITKLKKSYAFGKLVSVTEPSPDRIESDCPYFGKGCGGCTFRNISYDAELCLKEKQVRNKIERLGGIENLVMEPIIPAPEIFRYRNKAQAPVSTGGIITKKGGIVVALEDPKIGFYKGKSHDVVDIDDCMLQSPAALAAMKALKQFMKEDNITAYDEKWDKGLMKHIVVKTSEVTNEVMVILVINGRGIPNSEKLIGMLDDEIYDAGYNLESVVVNVNKGKSTQIMSDEYMVIAGKKVIESELLGLKFEVSPLAFYQVNTYQTENLYSKAIEYADLKGGEIVFDLYCGVGTIGLVAADRLRTIAREKLGDVSPEELLQNSGYVYGIESVKGAVIDANRNAVINGIVNAEFVCGLAEEKIDEILEGRNPDVVFIDPPRSGCDQKLLETIKSAKPAKVVYVSCDPATMARDIKILSDTYELEKAVAVDMFPRCNNVETVCKLVYKG
ncbi:MAG: 23S rRNA (uracil(1939)-C(5))-methyltransferase RlmD [Firmicutes bacterium]|nr:23S rRNA (uracil(1939)-C(5))-methyltransferase RlmD [Bacillota bacterium]MBQ9972275.1 23S rRNA (uracil(1939)-C(5))-methyltransferase RlmD [Bacillota bacterium]